VSTVLVEYVSRVDPVGIHDDEFSAFLAFCLSGTRPGRGRCKEARGPDELSPVGGRRVCSW
jgi:hypothetical protein